MRCLLFLWLTFFYSAAAQSEECLDIFVFITWFGFTINAVTLNPPLEMQQPQSFVAGTGYDYQVRYQTKTTDSGDVLFITQLKGLADSCQQAVTRSYPFKSRFSYEGGQLVCGSDVYELSINMNDVIESDACD